MRDVLGELLRILKLERIEENIFRGDSQDLGWGRVFGGQVLGQALSAAEQTVAPERQVHSLNAYFLRPGATDKPIVYLVDPIRDGGSFTTRRVVAVQSGEPIFNMAASFQAEEPGFDHAAEAPSAEGPDGLLSEVELAQRYLGKLPEAIRSAVPEKVVSQALADRPIEIRPVHPIDPMNPGIRPPQRQAWFRTVGSLPDVPAVHRYLLAYASDFHFLLTSMQPHGVSMMTPGVQIASLDHTMWFLRPFRMDEWLLYDVVSPSASGARGLVQGRFFRTDGTLVAVTTQEGLIRDRRSPRPAPL